jgi:hypothetical protein
VESAFDSDPPCNALVFAEETVVATRESAPANETADAMANMRMIFKL